MTDWINKFDQRRRSMREALCRVQLEHPDLIEDCVALIQEAEDAFDRVLEGGETLVPIEAGKLREKLEALIEKTSSKG